MNGWCSLSSIVPVVPYLTFTKLFMLMFFLILFYFKFESIYGNVIGRRISYFPVPSPFIITPFPSAAAVGDDDDAGDDDDDDDVKG